MILASKSKYTFVSQGLEKNTFTVVRFRGEEALSRCYQFDIELVSAKSDIPLAEVMKKPAVFTIIRATGEPVVFHGFLAEFEQGHVFQDYVFFRARLVPKLWWLSLARHNQVFLDMSVPEILEAVFKDGGLTSLDFELRLQKEYPKLDYVCQYDESHLDFAKRWMEREGICFFFEQTINGDKVILTDSKLAHQDMPEGKKLVFSPPTGLDQDHTEEVVHQFICRQRMVPQKVVLVDYNYEKPSMVLNSEAVVDMDLGRGEDYLYGQNFRTQEDGKRLAGIRAEEHLCRRSRFLGESAVPFIRPGYTFSLSDHFRPDFNQMYLTTEMIHEGSQVFFLVAGLHAAFSEQDQRLFYGNSFTAIRSDVQFRPQRETPRARFHGTISARIDGSGGSEYAEVDEQGRYKVVLPFDRSGRKDGKASAWFRMAQPYVGSDHGMHFPLHKGTEVLLNFIDGDPDRPVITGAVPNPLTPSQVTSTSNTMSKITTGGQNKIHIEDQKGEERILMQSPTADSWMRMGAPNDPWDGIGGSGNPWDDPLTPNPLIDPVQLVATSAWKEVSKFFSDGWKSIEKNGYFFHSKGWINFDALGGKFEVTAGTGKIAINLSGHKLDVNLGSTSWKLNVGADVVGNLSGKIGLDLTLKLVAGEKEIKAFLTKTEALGKKIFGSASQTNVNGNKNDMSANKNEVSGAKLKANTNETGVAASKQDLLSNYVMANSSEIKALASKIDALATKVENHATKISSNASEITSNATKLGNHATEMKTLGTKMDNIGATMKNSTVKMNNSFTVSMEG